MSIPFVLKPAAISQTMDLKIDLQKINLSYIFKNLNNNQKLSTNVVLRTYKNNIIKFLVKHYSTKITYFYSEKEFKSLLKKTKSAFNISILDNVYFEAILKINKNKEYTPLLDKSVKKYLCSIKNFENLKKELINNARDYVEETNDLIRDFESTHFDKNYFLELLKKKYDNNISYYNDFNRVLLKVHINDVSYLFSTIFKNVKPDKVFNDFYTSYILLPFENTTENVTILDNYLSLIDKKNSFFKVYKPDEKIPFLGKFQLKDISGKKTSVLKTNETNKRANYGNTYYILKSFDSLFSKIEKSKPLNLAGNKDKYLRSEDTLRAIYSLNFKLCSDKLGFDIKYNYFYCQKAVNKDERDYYRYYRKLPELSIEQHLYTPSSLALPLKDYSNVFALDIDIRNEDDLPQDAYLEFLKSIDFIPFFTEQSIKKSSNGIHAYFKLNDRINNFYRKLLITELRELMKDFISKSKKYKNKEINFDLITSEKALKLPLSIDYNPVSNHDFKLIDLNSLENKLNYLQDSLKDPVINDLRSIITPNYINPLLFNIGKTDIESLFVENPESLTAYSTNKIKVNNFDLENIVKSYQMHSGHRCEAMAFLLPKYKKLGYSYDESIDKIKENNYVSSADIERKGWDWQSGQTRGFWDNINISEKIDGTSNLKSYISNRNLVDLSSKKSKKMINSLKKELVKKAKSLYTYNKIINRKVNEAIETAIELIGKKQYRSLSGTEYKEEHIKYLNPEIKSATPFSLKEFSYLKKELDIKSTRYEIFKLLENILIENTYIYKDSNNKEHYSIHAIFKDQKKITKKLCKHYKVFSIEEAYNNLETIQLEKYVEDLKGLRSSSFMLEISVKEIGYKKRKNNTLCYQVLIEGISRLPDI